MLEVAIVSAVDRNFDSFDYTMNSDSYSDFGSENFVDLGFVVVVVSVDS